MLNQHALEVVDINKSFFQNPVLKGVSFGIKKGEVLGLLGANGAGKSTLMKIINGVYRLDSGEIRLGGKPVAIKSASDASDNGIAMVYQEFSIIPTLTVAQNFFLGRYKKKGFLIDDKECIRLAKQALDDFGVDIDPNEVVENLSIGNQQLVEIVKALLKKPLVLILDEPTASLTHKEIDLLFDFISRLKKQGIAIFLITHHMQEIMRICDRVVILRNGRVEMDDSISNVSIPIMIEAMIGKKLTTSFLEPAKKIEYIKPILEVQNLHYKNLINNINFEVYPNEIVGIAGLMGSGRTELLKCIYGLLKPDNGLVKINGTETVHSKPWESIKRGIVFVPEDRRKSGIVSVHSIKHNMLMSIWRSIEKFKLIDEKKSVELAETMKNKIDIRCTSIEQEVQELSGGNQQKVVFSKSMLSQPQILLLDDPTVGIDVEAKASLATLVRQISDSGSGVILVSSEMDQLEHLCDRVFIMSEGKFTKELNRSQGDAITESVLSELIQI